MCFVGLGISGGIVAALLLFSFFLRPSRGRGCGCIFFKDKLAMLVDMIVVGRDWEFEVEFSEFADVRMARVVCLLADRKTLIPKSARCAGWLCLVHVPTMSP